MTADDRPPTTERKVVSCRLFSFLIDLGQSNTHLLLILALLVGIRGAAFLTRLKENYLGNTFVGVNTGG